MLAKYVSINYMCEYMYIGMDMCPCAYIWKFLCVYIFEIHFEVIILVFASFTTCPPIFS